MSANGNYYSAQIREKFHKLFLRENRRFVKHPTAQSRDANFHSSSIREKLCSPPIDERDGIGNFYRRLSLG
jgi:hypothetical protein